MFGLDDLRVESQTSRWQLKDGNVWQTSRFPFSPEKTPMDDNSRFSLVARHRRASPQIALSSRYAATR